MGLFRDARNLNSAATGDDAAVGQAAPELPETTRPTKSTRGLWGRIGLVVVVGITGFGLTAAVRSGSDDAAATPAATASTTTSNPTTTEADSAGEVGAPATPEVAEVPMRILGPIADAGLPDPPEVGADDVPTDVTEILSPVVGAAMVPSGGGSSAESWSPAPPEFAAQLGRSVPDVDIDGSGTSGTDPATSEPSGPSDPSGTSGEVTDPDDAPDVVEIDGDLLDAIRRRAVEERASEHPSSDDDPTLGDPIEEASDSADGDADSTDGIIHFLDPCADVDSGADDAEACPDPGEPATVTRNFALQTPPPFTITITVNPTGECAAAVADDQVRLQIETSTPIEELGFQWRNELVHNDNQQVLVATPEAERAAWMAEFEAIVDGPPPAPLVQCLTLDGFERTDAVGYVYWYGGLDVFDQRTSSNRSHEGEQYFTLPLQIPPTTVWTLNDNELLVNAAHRADQHIRIYAFKRTGGTGGIMADPCERFRIRAPGFEPAWQPLEMTHSTSDADALSAAGFDPDYNERSGGTMALDEGSRYRLCVYWSVSSPSFAAGLEKTEGYDLITPDALEMSFQFVDLDIAGSEPAGLARGDLSFDVTSYSRPLIAGHSGFCSWSNDEPIDHSIHKDTLLCDVPASSNHMYRNGAVVSLRARDSAGETHTSRQVIRTHTCTGLCVPPDSQLFRIELPTGAPGREFWCLGDDCNRPTEGSYGTVLLRVDYGNDHGTQNANWTVSEPDEIGAPPPELPELPQLDLFQHPIVSGPGRSQTVTLPVIADRNVVVSAELLNPDGSPACVDERGDSTASDPSAYRRDHTLTFRGLCPGQTLIPVVTLTDSSGNQSVWHRMIGVDGFPADAGYWPRGFVSTELIGWEYTADVAVTVPTSHYRLLALDTNLSGSAGTGGRSSSHGCNPAVGPIESVGSGSDGTGADITISVTVDLELLRGSCFLPADGFVQPGPHTLQLPTMTVHDVAVGDVFTIDDSFPVAGLRDPDATVDVVATITITSET